MIRINFSEKDMETLRFERFNNPSIRIQQKMEALYLKSKKLRHSEICRICEISRPTLIAYLKEFQQGGIRQLKESTIYKVKVREVKPIQKQSA